VPIIVGPSGWKKSAHVTCVGGSRTTKTLERIDVSLRLGNGASSWGLPDFGLADDTSPMRPSLMRTRIFKLKQRGERGHGVIAEDRAIFLEELCRKEKGAHVRTNNHSIRARAISAGAQFSRCGEGLCIGEGKDWEEKFQTKGCCQDIRD